MSEWNGIFLGGETWYVGPMPGRKMVALYAYTRPGIAAWFPEEEDARAFLRWLNRLAGFSDE